MRTTATTSSRPRRPTMTKEIVIERYGPLRYTVGNGGSAASMQQHLLVENYPGLLDGMITSQALPRPHGSGARIARLPPPVPLLLADEPAAEPGARYGAAERAVPDAGLAAAGVRQQSHESGQPLRSEDPRLRRRSDRAPRRPSGVALRAGRRAHLDARPIRPGSAAAPSTTCVRSSAFRSPPTHRTGRAGARPTTWASSTG